MTKVLFPCCYYPPETAAGIYYTQDVVTECAKNGIDVTLQTPTPTRNVSENAKWVRKEWLCDGHLYIHRFHMYGEGKNPLLRAFRYLFCELVYFHYALWSEYDVIFVDSTPPIQGLKMPFIKWSRRKPFVYNAQDIFPDSLVSAGLTHVGSLIWKIGRVVEKITYKYADKIIVISEDFKNNLLAKGVPAEKIEVVYNWVDQNAVVNVDRAENKLFDKYGLDRSKFYLEYSGNIGLTQNMDMLLECMNDFQKDCPDLHLVLVGEGAYKAQVEEIVKRDNLQNVHMLPFQPYEDISYVFSLGDAGLVISKPCVGANSVPSKTWSIMSASRPVLANFDENELKDIISNNNCGIFTKAGDKEAFKESILTLYKNRELAREMGKNGRTFVMNNLTREVGTAKYVEVIKNVVKEKNK